MEEKKIKIILLAAVWLLVFCWGLFLTYGIPFFFEDFHFLHLDKEFCSFEVNPHPTLQKTIISFVKEFFSPKRLMRAGFTATLEDRPYIFLSNDLLSIIFTDKIVLYRLFRAALLAANACLLFLIIARASRLFAFLGVFLYASSAQVWAVLVGASDVNLYSQLAIIICVSVFLRLLEDENPGFKRCFIGYLLILCASQYAVLAKGDGRYLGVCFLLTLLFFRRRELKYHLPMLTLLLFTEIPLLGYAKKLFINGSFVPLDISSHNATAFGEGLKLAFRNRDFPIAALGKLLVALLLISVLIHIIFLLLRRRSVAGKINDARISLQGERTFFFMLYFISAFSMITISRNFNYGGLFSISFSECISFVAPFIAFLCYYILFVANKMKRSWRSSFISLSTVLIFAQIFLMEMPRINRFRGAWGNYFCAKHNTEKYIDKISDNALVLSIDPMPYKPFVFRGSNNRVLANNAPLDKNPFCELSFIEAKFKDAYKDIFVVNSFTELVFRGSSQKIVLKDKTVIDGDSGDLYDRLKRIVARPSRQIEYVYHFTPK